MQHETLEHLASYAFAQLDRFSFSEYPRDEHAIRSTTRIAEESISAYKKLEEALGFDPLKEERGHKLERYLLQYAVGLAIAESVLSLVKKGDRQQSETPLFLDWEKRTPFNKIYNTIKQYNIIQLRSPRKKLEKIRRDFPSPEGWRSGTPDDEGSQKTPIFYEVMNHQGEIKTAVVNPGEKTEGGFWLDMMGRPLGLLVYHPLWRYRNRSKRFP